MPAVIGLSLFALLALLAGLIVAVPQTFAVEEMRDFNKDGASPKKTGKVKACPKGTKFSASKRGCVKVSCGVGQVWARDPGACLDANSASLADADLYLAAGELVEDGRHADALQFLFRIEDRNNPQVLNLIGYATRKAGNLDEGIDYYLQALAVDPDYVKARQYLGEGYLLKGDVEKAKEQLDEIGKRCGGPCEEYKLLVDAIAAHVAEEPNPGW
jgi:tetratricopeptide (TPR) repeat protein